MIRALFLCYRGLLWVGGLFGWGRTGRPVGQVGRIVVWFLPRIFTELGTDFHNSVFICAMFCVILCLFCRTAAVVSDLSGCAAVIVCGVAAVYNFLRVKASMKLSGVMLMICRLIWRAKRSMVW